MFEATLDRSLAHFSNPEERLRYESAAKYAGWLVVPYLYAEDGGKYAVAIFAPNGERIPGYCELTGHQTMKQAIASGKQWIDSQLDELDAAS